MIEFKYTYFLSGQSTLDITLAIKAFKHIHCIVIKYYL